MKYLPQLMLLAAFAVLLAKTSFAQAGESRLGLSLALQSGQIHFSAQIGSGQLAVKI